MGGVDGGRSAPAWRWRFVADVKADGYEPAWPNKFGKWRRLFFNCAACLRRRRGSGLAKSLGFGRQAYLCPAIWRGRYGLLCRK